MKRSHSLKGVPKVVATTSMIAEDAPILEPGDGVLDTGSSAAVAAPGGVATYTTADKPRGHELVDASIAPVGEHPSMTPAQAFDGGAAVVDWIVPIARPTRFGGDHVKVRSADQDLGIA